MKNLYEKFINNGNEISPSLASDWEVVWSDKIDHINLESKSTNQKIMFKVQDFVDFINSHRDWIDISATKLKGEFIINKHLNIVPKKDYQDWQIDQYNIKNIENNPLKIGYQYILKNKTKIVYLGFKYVSKLIDDKYISFDRISEIKKTHYILINNEVSELTEYIEDFSNLKILSENECEETLTYFYNENYEIAAFENKQPQNPSYGFVKAYISSPFLKIGDKFYTKVQNSKNIKSSLLFNKEYKKKENVLEFQLDLKEKDFCEGEYIPINKNKSNDIELVRIGLL